MTRIYSCVHRPAEYLGDAAVGDLEDPGDVAGPGAGVRQLHDLLSRGVGQRPPVHVHPAQLVHPAVPCNNRGYPVHSPYVGGEYSLTK